MALKVGAIYGELVLVTANWDRAMGGVERRQQAFQQRINAANASLRRMGIAMTAIGVAVGGVIRKAVNEFAVFDKAMRHATSVSEIANEQFIQMSNMAEDAAIRWNKAAEERADAFYYLGSAGLSAAEQIASFNTVLMLSRAVGDEVVNTARGLVDVTRAFGLSFEQSAHTADILTQTVITSNQVFKDLTDSMRYGSAVARETNNTLAETTAAFGIMANSGIRGSMAGTVFRRALTNLMGPSVAMKEIMRDLAISIYDTEGAMKPLIQIIGEISDALDGTTEKYKNMVFEILFGRRAIAGMLQIFNYGSVAMRAYADSIERAGGATKRVAEKQMVALSERAGQVLQEFKKLVRHIASTLVPTLQELFKTIKPKIALFTEWVDANHKLVGTILKVTSGIAALSLALGSFLIVLPFVIKGLVTVIFFAGKLLLPLALLQSAVVILGVAWDENWLKMQDTTEKRVNNITDAIQLAYRGWILLFNLGNKLIDKFEADFKRQKIAMSIKKEIMDALGAGAISLRTSFKLSNWLETADFKRKLLYAKDLMEDTLLTFIEDAPLRMKALGDETVRSMALMSQLGHIMGTSLKDLELEMPTIKAEDIEPISKKVEKLFKNLIDAAVESVMSNWNSVKNILKLEYPELFAKLEDLMNMLKKIGEIPTIVDPDMPKILSAANKEMWKLISGTWEITRAAEKFKAIWGTSIEYVGEEFKSMGDILSGVILDLKNDWADLLEDWISGAEGLRDTLNSLFAAIRQAFYRLVAQLAAQSLFDAMFGTEGVKKGKGTLADILYPLWNLLFSKSLKGADIPAFPPGYGPPGQMLPPSPSIGYTGIPEASSGEIMMPSAQKIAPPNIGITIQNNTGTPIRMSGEEPYFDGKQWVASMVLEAIDTMPQFRNVVGALT